MKLEYTITKDDNFLNLKEVLKTKFQISNRLLIKLKQLNLIFLNNNPSPIYSEIKTGDIISIILNYDEDNSNIVATKMPLEIIYEDDYYLIINKPSGIPVHPSINNYENTLLNGIKYYFDSIQLKKKLRLVNRLDKDTSGIIVVAKNEYIQECLIKQMQSNIFEKIYIAICEGTFSKKAGIIEAPISRKSDSIIERCVAPNGALAITYYTVLASSKNLNYIECKLKTR